MIYVLLIFVIALFVIMFVVSFFFSILSTILSWLGIGRNRNSSTSGQTGGSYTAKDDTKEYVSPNKGRKKLFADDEGEYVDFEEIK